MGNINKYIVCQKQNIRAAIKKMDEGGIGFVVCVDADENVVGVISDGDFRRAILSGISLNENVLNMVNRKFKYLTKGYSDDKLSNLFKVAAVQHVPILQDGKLIDIITEENFYGIKQKRKRRMGIDGSPVVIMAGGKGTRLDPFTRILPKALIPIGDKPMLEIIMDEYAQYSMVEFYLLVKHKSKMIKAYFEDHESEYKINYINESYPLGTAGALKYLEGVLDKTFFVSNCDILIKDDYSEIYKFHKENKFDITLIAFVQHHMVPYGVCEIENGGHLKKIMEKPEYDFLINAGMYLLEPDICNLIHKDAYLDMPELINKAKREGKEIGVYPVSEKSYIDVGHLGEYKNALKLLLDN